MKTTVQQLNNIEDQIEKLNKKLDDLYKRKAILVDRMNKVLFTRDFRVDPVSSIEINKLKIKVSRMGIAKQEELRSQKWQSEGRCGKCSMLITGEFEDKRSINNPLICKGCAGEPLPEELQMTEQNHYFKSSK